jgi:hypothetical protein
MALRGILRVTELFMADSKEKKMFYIDAALARELDLIKLITNRPLSDLANEAITDLVEKYHEKVQAKGKDLFRAKKITKDNG